MNYTLLIFFYKISISENLLWDFVFHTLFTLVDSRSSKISNYDIEMVPKMEDLVYKKNMFMDHIGRYI